MVRIGVLGIQGDVREHRQMLEGLGVDTCLVKRTRDLEGLSGLVLPGGESTTIGMLMQEYGLIDALRADPVPMFGTCAGAILMAKDIIGSAQPGLRLMDVHIARNAFGRQRESFEVDLSIRGFDRPIHAVFIRAPYIESVDEGVDVLAEVDGHIVLCRQGFYLAGSFHPEMTDDNRLHRFFVEEIVGEWERNRVQ